eukprot:15447314-Alexandrium_andersonii.AAC.1
MALDACVRPGPRGRGHASGRGPRWRTSFALTSGGRRRKPNSWTPSTLCAPSPCPNSWLPCAP